jgi:hypothetical protein
MYSAIVCPFIHHASVFPKAAGKATMSNIHTQQGNQGQYQQPFLRLPLLGLLGLPWLEKGCLFRPIGEPLPLAL